MAWHCFLGVFASSKTAFSVFVQAKDLMFWTNLYMAASAASHSRFFGQCSVRKQRRIGTGTHLRPVVSVFFSFTNLLPKMIRSRRRLARGFGVRFHARKLQWISYTAGCFWPENRFCLAVGVSGWSEVCRRTHLKRS